MTTTVIYDANVLFPAPLRDLLLRIAMAGVVRARWTDVILDECFRNIRRNRPDLTVGRLHRTRDLMNRAIRDVRVTGFEALITDFNLPDPNDRHVLAAAVKADAQAIVTFNLRDFPASVLGPLGIEALHPDVFVCDLLEQSPAAVGAVVEDQAKALLHPPKTLQELFEILERQGLSRAVARLRALSSLSS